jgi:hypothetical protein
MPDEVQQHPVNAAVSGTKDHLHGIPVRLGKMSMGPLKVSLIAIAVIVSLAIAAAVAGPIMFEEIAAKCGLDFTSNSSPTMNKNQPETMVAGWRCSITTTMGIWTSIW